MEIINTLESLGISKKEAKILYACMQSNGLKASNISKKTGIERTNVYKTLDNLISKGFITIHTSENITKYRSLEPKELLNQLKNSVKDFKRILPVLNKVYEDNTKVPKIELFSGRTAIKKVLISVVSKKNTYYAFGGVEQAYKQNYFENIPAGLIAKEIKTKGKVILSPGEKTIIIPNEKYRIASRQLPRDICTILSEDVVIIFTWGDACNAIVIYDEKIAKDYLILFENIWKEAKPISHKQISSDSLRLDLHFDISKK